MMTSASIATKGKTSHPKTGTDFIPRAATGPTDRTSKQGGSDD